VILLLDSSVLIDLLNMRKGRHLLLAKLVEDGHILATAPINLAEVYAGMRPHEASRTDAVLRQLQVYDTTREIGRRAGMLKNDAARSGVTLALADMTVAATALEHGLTLMTDNRKDFPFPELKFFELP
jgi:predicted nucleic acid-binding protein